ARDSEGRLHRGWGSGARRVVRARSGHAGRCAPRETPPNIQEAARRCPEGGARVRRPRAAASVAGGEPARLLAERARPWPQRPESIPQALGGGGGGGADRGDLRQTPWDLGGR